MAIVSFPTGLDVQWYASNYNQYLLALFYGGGSSGTSLDTRGFRYTNTSNNQFVTDINDVYLDLTINSYVSGRWGDSGHSNTHYKYRMPEDTINTLTNNGKTYEKIVIYYSLEGDKTIEVGSYTDDSATSEGHPNGYALNGANVGYFRVACLCTDGTILMNEVGGWCSIVRCVSSDSTGVWGDHTGYNDYWGTSFRNGNNGSIGCINGGYFNYSQSTSYSSPCKIFPSEADALLYLRYGIDNSAEELEEEEEPEVETTSAHKYYRLTQYRYNDLGLTSLHDVVSKSLEVTFEDYPITNDATTGSEPIIASADASGNISFIIHTGFNQYIDSATVKIGNTTTNNVSGASIMALNTFTWGLCESNNPHYYIKSVVTTNMIVKNASGQTINNAVTDSDDMLGNTNSADYDCGLSECWLIDKNAMKNIAQTFNTTIKRGTNNSSAYVMGEWIVGLSAYSNPLDVVCDLFYMPIDLTDYCTTTTTSFSLIPASSDE